MANGNLLNSYWRRSGKTKRHVADELNVSRPKLDKIFRNPETATYTQVAILAREFDITSKAEKDSIFLP